MAAGRVDPQALSAGHNTSLHGLRGLCVAAVFAFHVAASGLAPAPAADSPWQLAAGWLVGSLAHGVEVFFMISGYVIVLSLRRHADMRGFLIDRCLRIFPLWMPMLLAIAAVSPWRQEHAALAAWDWLAVVGANLLLLAPLLPLPQLHPASWSLTIEWLFYGAAAATVALWRWPAFPRWALLVLVAVVAVGAAWLLPVALCFGVGVAVGLVPAQRLPRWPGLAAPLLLLFLLLWHGIDAAGLDRGATLPALLRLGQGPALLAALAAGALGMACLCAPGFSALPVLRRPLLQGLGSISYGFYLWHLLVMFATKRVLLRAWPDGVDGWGLTLLFAAVSLALSCGLAWLSWHWVEKALCRWLRQRLPRLRPRRSVWAA